nr:hypothetical protein [uncultured Flavobacterium sp.]
MNIHAKQPKQPKQYVYTFYIKIGGQEFETGRKSVYAHSYDEAENLFNKLDLPFHHYSTVETK